MNEPEIRQADSGIVTDAELTEITQRHIRGDWQQHEMHLSWWEI